MFNSTTTLLRSCTVFKPHFPFKRHYSHLLGKGAYSSALPTWASLTNQLFLLLFEITELPGISLERECLLHMTVFTPVANNVNIHLFSGEHEPNTVVHISVYNKSTRTSALQRTISPHAVIEIRIKMLNRLLRQFPGFSKLFSP